MAWDNKIVIITLNIRTTAQNEELARAVAEYVQGDVFKEGVIGALTGSIGDEFDLETGGNVQVEDDEPA